MESLFKENSCDNLGSAQSLPVASTLSGRTGVRVFVRQRRRLETAAGF